MSQLKEPNLLFKNPNELTSSTNSVEEPTFMDKLNEIMSDPQFKTFFNKYFQNWTDIKTTIMLMKTYYFIDEEYTKRTGKKMAGDEISEVLKKMIQDTHCRKLIVDEMDQFMGEKSKFLEYYRDTIPQRLLKN